MSLMYIPRHAQSTQPPFGLSVACNTTNDKMTSQPSDDEAYLPVSEIEHL